MAEPTPETVGSAKDCKWPSCNDGKGGCKLNYPCTKQNDRVSRDIEDPAITPVAA